MGPQETPRPPSEKPARVLLQTRNLCKSYNGFRVLQGLDLTVREGQIYGFLGRNGAGKTTAIQILMGILKPDGGRLHLLGHTVNRPTLAQKRRIGYVSQEQFFYPWMRCRQLGHFAGKFYPTWDSAYFERLLQLFDLPPKRKVVNLSQGMRVKLALALALAHRPAILILDEPTAGLDPAARREFLEIVSHQAGSERHTTLFSSHIVEEVERIAHRVGILHAGRLCYQGPLTKLVETVREVEPTTPTGIGPETWDLLHSYARSAGFQLLTEARDAFKLILRGEPHQWSAWRPPLAVKIRKLSLEDIFLALTMPRDLAP